MGKKYIIELLDDCPSEFKGIMVFGLTQEEQISVELIPEESLKPYTEPDLEQVRKEAYEKGYENGFVAGHLKAEKSGQSFYKGGYQRGLADAWDAARKLMLDTNHGGLTNYEIEEIFGVDEEQTLINYSASEVIKEIWEYEQAQKEKEEQIHVGDEVITASGKAVVTGVGPVFFEYFYADGSHGYDKVKNVKKTGRHFPEIAEVLQKMKEA